MFDLYVNPNYSQPVAIWLRKCEAGIGEGKVVWKEEGWEVSC